MPAQATPSYVLLVEDNYIIALDTQDMLREIGIECVRVAHSVSEAMGAITGGLPKFAFLDVGLGHEECFEIATRLRGLGVPFAFATGYGKFNSFPVDFADVEIVAKPYTVETLRRAYRPR